MSSSWPFRPEADLEAGSLQGLPPERFLQDWRAAHARAVAYLEALAIGPAERDTLAWRAVRDAALEPTWPEGADALARTLEAARRLVCEVLPTPGGDVPLGGAGRLRRWLGAASAVALRDGRLVSMSELTRGHMTPRRLPRLFSAWLGRRGRHLAGARAAEQRERRAARVRRPWAGAARRRRLFLAVLVLIPSVIAAGFMQNVLPQRGGTVLEVALSLVFGALFGWISIGFWTALLGFASLVRGDRFQITRLAGDSLKPIAPEARTALVMPIREEPVGRVFAGLRAIHRSLERAGALAHFDFFVLSDSADPSCWVQEELAWAEWCREVGGFGRIFYRRRRVRRRRKNGNIADFCRRVGRRYRYMVVLDADSVMAGPTLERMVQTMEANPDVAVIQTVPVATGRRSLFGRMQQFASRLYGPLFSAGLSYWQLGDGQYWGHNAILRVAPFMENCALSPLPGRPPLGGDIWSHDFVEAAYLGRAGYALWLAYELPGSFEETPATVLEEMQRDRRWCQGNLQHLRLFFTEGLSPAHRALFLNGVMSYVSSALWFGFLALGTAHAISEATREPEYFPSGRSLFPEWPVGRPNWALSLAAVTLAILFLPKLLAVILAVFRREARGFGGVAKLLASTLIEILTSSLLAPIRMVFHSRFVLLNLLGREVPWRSQSRGDRETSWARALRAHGADTLVASAWGFGLFWLNPAYFWWVTPVIGALVLSIPISVLSSRVRAGEWARRHGWFAIPQESDPPQELRDLDAAAAHASAEAQSFPPAEADGFVRAAVDPFANAIHCALQRATRRLRPRILAARRALLARALAEGPAALSPREKGVLLSDAELSADLHRQVWALSDPARAALWGRPGQAL